MTEDLRNFVLFKLHTGLEAFSHQSSSLEAFRIPLPPTWLSFVVGSASVATFWLLGEKLKIGWKVSLLNQVGWIWIALATHQYGLMISALFFAYLAIRGHQKWTRDERQAVPGLKNNGDSDVVEESD